MSFEPPSEKSTFKGRTRDGWTFIASLTKRGRYVVAVRLFSPDGQPYGSPKRWIAGSFAMLEEAHDGAVRYAHQLTPAELHPLLANSAFKRPKQRALYLLADAQSA